MYIGAHVSTKGGYLEAAKKAYGMGANAFQFFPVNPRSLHVKAFHLPDAEACARFCREKGLLSIGHSPYPLNLAVERERHRPMVDALLNGLDIANACGSVGLVVHFGKYGGRDLVQGYKNIICTLDETLRRWRGNALLLLENQAGGGTPMGTTMEEMVHIRSLSGEPDKIGFCLDTCHAFAGGLWDGGDWSRVQSEGERLGYMAHLKAVHLNDSVYPAGSKRDRHANIGRGRIGDDGFRAFLHSPCIRGIPVILETAPAADGTHREEIAHVKSLL